VLFVTYSSSGIGRFSFDFFVLPVITIRHRGYTWGDQKIPGIVKKIYLKYLYNFETLVPFEVLPLRLDAATPAPLPMLEILSKIFTGNAVKGRQLIAGGP